MAPAALVSRWAGCGYPTARQQPPVAGTIWMGGHGTEPYEQKTQQSPSFGLNSVPHPLHA